MSIGKNKNSFAIFGLLFGASVWGIIWYPYRLLEQSGVPGVTASFYTYFIAMLIGCFVFRKQWRGLLLQPKSIFWLVLAAGWTNLSFVLAVIHGEVMRVTLLFYLSPIWTLILAHFWLKERAGIKEVLVIFISLIGASTMLYDPLQPNSLPLPQSVSDWLAVSAGLGFALTNVITRKSDHLSLVAKAFSIWGGVVLLSLIGILFFGADFTAPTAFSEANWGIILLVSFMLFASALLVQYGVTHIAATSASVIFLFELVVAALAAYLLAGEAMDLNEWIGGALIVSAAIYSSKNSATD